MEEGQQVVRGNKGAGKLQLALEALDIAVDKLCWNSEMRGLQMAHNKA